MKRRTWLIIAVIVGIILILVINSRIEERKLYDQLDNFKRSIQEKYPYIIVLFRPKRIYGFILQKN